MPSPNSLGIAPLPQQGGAGLLPMGAGFGAMGGGMGGMPMGGMSAMGGMGGMGGMGAMGGMSAMGGGMQQQQLGARPASEAAPALAEELSEPKQLLRPDLSGGLSVALVFRFNVQASTYNGASAVYLVLRNCGDQPLR